MWLMGNGYSNRWFGRRNSEQEVDCVTHGRAQSPLWKASGSHLSDGRLSDLRAVFCMHGWPLLNKARLANPQRQSRYCHPLEHSHTHTHTQRQTHTHTHRKTHTHTHTHRKTNTHPPYPPWAVFETSSAVSTVTLPVFQGHHCSVEGRGGEQQGTDVTVAVESHFLTSRLAAKAHGERAEENKVDTVLP